MGKRELLLIAAFLIVGSAVYWATAPEPAPGQRGLSISNFIDHVRREIRGNSSSAEVTATSTLEVKPGVSEIRFEIGASPLTIVGENRKDLVCELGVWSNGVDEAEAKKYASETKLKVSDAGPSLVIGISYPQPGTQRATLVVRMPSALSVRIQPSRGKLEISNVASVELVESRGMVIVRGVKGRLAATHRGGALTVESTGALKLNSRGSNIALKDIGGEILAQLQAGELRGSHLAGPIEIESNGTTIALDALGETHKPIRVNATGGSVSIDGIATDTRVDGRDTRIDLKVERPVPIAVYNENDEPTRVTLPIGGFQIDALAIDGTLTVPEGLLRVKVDGNEQRASGVIKGGGPTMTLRSSRGRIELIAPKSPT